MMRRAAEYHNVMSEIEKEYPTQKTLDKYGISRQEFYEILKAQDNVCPICEKSPSTGRWVIDHEHVRNWKSLPAEKRRLYIRGILCWFCNSVYLGRAITIKKSQNVTRYLKSYAIRQKRTV